MNKQKRVVQADPERPNPYLEYFSKFKQLTHLPPDLSSLGDGVVLIQLFQMIKGFTLVGEFDERPKTFSHRFSNLKMLFMSVEKYWNEQLQAEIESDDIDIVEIGHYGSGPQVEKFLELFVKTVARSDNNYAFIERILDTSQLTQEFLKKVIQKAIKPAAKESPRKQKEKRMIDRLFELDHENQKLQQFISTICDEKLQLQGKLKSLSDSLLQKSSQIQKLQTLLDDQIYTPRKKKIYGIPDTSDKKDNQIQSLKHQIIEMGTQHQKQIQECLAEIERLSYKAQLYQKTKGQLQLSQSIIQSHQQLTRQAQQMESSLSQHRAELMNRENTIYVLRDKLSKYETNIIELQKNQLNLKVQLQRKNVVISQLSAKIQRSSPKKGDVHHNLYLQFPEIVNTEANAYIQTNRALREQLERSRLALQKTSAKLQLASAQLQGLRKCETENGKLNELIIQEKTHKGEEIDILVNALYHLRKRVREGGVDRALKVKNV